jgi:choline dehydrogenase-like flavoprotein
VLDLNCRAHDLENLYVVDGSFFVSSGAVNPTLTIIANSLRVGDHLLERLGSRRRKEAEIKPHNEMDCLVTSAATIQEPVFAK